MTRIREEEEEDHHHQSIIIISWLFSLNNHLKLSRNVNEHQ